MIQYRDKISDLEGQIANVRAIRKALEGTHVPLIVNDHSTVASAGGADGVHLGRDDMAPARARHLLGADAIIGITIKTLQEARNLPLEECDYVCIGGVFATMSKRNPAAIGLAGWRSRAAVIRSRNRRLPIGAIAGINHENAPDLIAAGADGVAVISAIFMEEDVVAATQRLRQAIDGV